MKHLTEYIEEHRIQEDLNEPIVKNVIATYKRKDGSLLVQVPDSYNEDDLQKYIDDRCSANMPSDENNIEDLFGENAQHITDAYFEYEKLSVPQNSTVKPDLEWDKRYDTRNDKEVNLMTYSLDEFKYHMTFDEFKLTNMNDEEVKPILEDIFKSAESTQSHPWEIEIIFDNVEFDN